MNIVETTTSYILRNRNDQPLWVSGYETLDQAQQTQQALKNQGHDIIIVKRVVATTEEIIGE